MSRPIPIQPYHGHGHGHGGPTPNSQVTIAPNLQPKKPEKPTGITIRTSKHWVLPPRPKPGRKPSPSLSIKQQVASVGSGRINGVAVSGKKSDTEDRNGGCGGSTTERSKVGCKSGISDVSTIPLSNSCKAGKLNKTSSVNSSSTTTLSEQCQGSKLSKNGDKEVSASSSSSSSSSLGQSKVHVKMEQLDVTLDQLQLHGTDLKKKASSKNALKKEIKLLKMENTQLKKELSQLVGNLQELKRQCPIPPEDENICPSNLPSSEDTNSSIPVTAKKNARQKQVGQLSLHNPQLEPQVNNDSNSRKRDIAESSVDGEFVTIKAEPKDDTEIFLKFDEDDEPSAGRSGPITATRISNSNSVSSKTSLTDDDDLLLSSSTPNSLFSTDLNRTISNQLVSNTTLATAGASPSSSHTSNKSVSTSQCSNPLEAMKFLDDYEETQFYSKYKLSAQNLDQALTPVQKIERESLKLQHEDLGCIKEEEVPNDLTSLRAPSSEHDAGMLYFLQKHALTKNPGSKLGDLPMDLDDTLPPSLFLKLEDGEVDEDACVKLNLNDDNVAIALNEVEDVAPFIAPTLEELMEEQDEKDSKLMGPEGTDQDIDILKLGIFFQES